MSEYDPLLTMSALNMAIVSLHRITSSGDRLILDREYDSIINNLKMAEINADKELMTLYGKILEVIQKGRLREDTREALKRDDSEKKQKSVKEIITGNVLKSFSFNPVKWLGKLAMSSASEYFTQKKEAQELASNNDESQLRLRHEELSEYSELQRILMSASWSLLRQYHLPDNYRLTQNALDKFSSAMNEHDPLKRHRMMKYFERDFAMYAPYWFYRAKSANESGNDDEAEKYFARFGEVWRPVLRKDPYRAEAMKYKIEALMRSGVYQDNVGEILKCLEEMRANTELDEWASNIFAGIVYFALGRKDEAEECVMCNIDFGFELEISGKILAQIETERLPQLCESGNAVKVEEAIRNGANVNAKDKYGRTALMMTNNADVAEVLIKHGADVNAENNDGWTALMLAGNADVAEVLIKHGADVNARGNNGRTALMWVAADGQAKIVEVLLKHGTDANAKDSDGWTALIWAAYKGHADVAEVLIKHGADVNARGNNGWTALMRAGNADVAEVLIKHGADVNAKDNHGKTALIWAKLFGHSEVVDLLRSYGAKE